MHNLKEIKVWQKAVELSIDIYQLTQSFPQEEKFGLVSQMRRSSVSIASNIAEGAGRSSDKEFAQFLAIANGSSFELLTQCTIRGKLQFLNIADFEKVENQIMELQKMIYAFKNRLKSNV
ncbi:four helix bundle protein [Cytophagales bacterium LB-30]|uniref:Four helix bundle protein n=1 Tax=Shiella aurantiaca TaxID=3058365 RepID=A0ABT8F574_9BACT|nr:four helix bundle protein [Shiella aurantiaca]MDN4165601.1 four helix bundle protein [Shiella aurantiaca]